MPSGMDEYLDNIRALEKFRRIVETVRSSGTIYIGGVYGSAFAVLIGALERAVGCSFIVVAPRLAKAESAMDDLGMFFPASDIASFPPPDQSGADENRGVLNARLSLLGRYVLGPAPRVAVTCIEALARPVWPRKALEKNFISISRGREIDVRGLESWLDERGLRRVPIAESPGEWSRRGAVLDVYSFAAVRPVRIELFGDTVESIREYNPASQTSIREIPDCGIIALDAEKSYSPSADGMPPTLLDYLDPSCAILFLNPEAMETRINEIFQRTADAKLPIMFERITAGDCGRARIFLTQMPKPQGAPGFDFNISPVEKFSDMAGSLATRIAALGEKKKKRSS